MGYISIHSSFAHLNQNEIAELLKRFIAGEKVSNLIHQFSIDISPNKFQKALPHKMLDVSCEVCGVDLIQEAPRRYGNTVAEGIIYCRNCGHRTIGICHCQKCIEVRHYKEMEELKISDVVLLDYLSERKNNCFAANYSLTDLSLEIVVAFLAFTRCCPVDSENICGPLENGEVPFSPTFELENELIAALHNAGLITISNLSSKEAISINEEIISYMPREVIWLVSPQCSISLIKEVELAGLTGNWPEHWYAEAQALWYRIAHSECRQYYDYCANMRGLKPQGERAVNEMLSNLLMDFSVGQAFRSIWHGAKSASDFLVSKGVSKAHAANYMIGATQRWADRARSEGWKVEPFKRNFDLPRSMISYVFFDVILKIGERGFTDIIYKENLV